MKTDHDCSCGSCTTEDLPVNPFEALRVSHGMLLGEDDFRAMLGNPRGKQMLHSSWLHGSGVVRGMGVAADGLLGLTVKPGLAVDGRGRELLLGSSFPVPIQDFLDDYDDVDAKKDCGTRKIKACLVAEFDCVAMLPVPVLADPCDVTRSHDAPSRIVESAKVRLAPGPCPPARTPYHRLRVLVGLEEPRGNGDDAGHEAARARAEILALPVAERTAAMLHQLRCLGAADAAAIKPAPEAGTEAPSWFPVDESGAAVVLACVTIKVRDDNDCTTVEALKIDTCCRRVLLPTQTIGDLLAGLATGLVGITEPGGPAPHGPRVKAEKARWEDGHTRLILPVTAAVAAETLGRRAVTVASLSAHGWSHEEIEAVKYNSTALEIEVELASAAQGLVRVVVKGTGPTPVYGRDPSAPLAGVVDGPLVPWEEGHDAVITFTDGRWNGSRS